MLDQDLHQLIHTAQRHHHRRLIVVSGSHHWCEETAIHILQEAGDRRLWIGEQPPPLVPALTADRARKVLGQELDLLVFDSHFGFDPDALGASIGAVKGGGLVVVLTHAAEDLPLWPDPENRRVTVAGFDAESLTQRYLQRIVRELEADQHLWWLQEHHPLPPLPVHRFRLPAHPLTIPPYRTPDQATAVASILETASGDEIRPTVLTADRGRGKTAALGIAAAQLIREQGSRIIVTAPRRDAIEPLLELATNLLPDVETHDDTLRAFAGKLDFLPPDRLLHEKPDCDIVFVDEAAAIPAPLLAAMLNRYPRIVFATTVHGYEGTGRGFALRFQRLLQEKAPAYSTVRMETPIRWAAEDPVEELFFKLLLLDATAAPDDAVRSATPQETTVEVIDRDLLVKDEELLRELFGLLVSAHYQTSPLDLRHLLDGPNLSIYVQRYQGHIVATALVAHEGGFDEETARSIWLSKRRPQGHLLAQSLSSYLGLEEAPQHHFSRILRIAVHPALQRQGLGRGLIEKVVEQSTAAGIDCLGSSFGATPELLDFWSACGCQTVRLGMRRDASSGEHSVLVLRPLSLSGEQLFQRASSRFHRGLPVWLESTLSDLEPALMERVTPDEQTYDDSLDDQDWLDLVAFAFALRSYEMVQRSVEVLVRHYFTETDIDSQLPDAQRQLLRLRVIQRHSWTECATQLGLSGRREVIDTLRQTIRTCVFSCAPEEIKQRAQKYTLEGREA